MPERPDATQPPGLLRLTVLFHEAESLGAGTSILRVVDELTRYGWSASGWFPRTGPLLVAERQLSAVLAADSPLAFSRRGWREHPGRGRRALHTPAYLRAVRAGLLRTRPHVVHANTLLSLPEAAVARSCGLPVVLQVHELPVATTKRDAAVRVAARIADVLVGVSDAVSTMLRRHAGRTPVLTVRNGVPPAAVGRTVDERPFTVGTIGTVSRVKGTDTFLAAARLALAERPSLRFEHVGAAELHRDPGLDDEIAAALGDPLATASITMRGAQPAETVLPQWDLFVLPSRSEGFPLAVLEAMAAGVTVVASSVGGTSEQIDHLRTGVLVSPDNPHELAAWIVRLHDEAPLREHLAAAAGRRVTADFTLARQAAGLHHAYLKALTLRFAPPLVRARAE